MIDISSAGSLELINNTMTADVIKATSFGPGGLTVTGGTYDAPTMLQFYAENGHNLTFRGAVDVRSNDARFAGRTVQVDNGGAVNVTGNVRVFRDVDNYNKAGLAPLTPPGPGAIFLTTAGPVEPGGKAHASEGVSRLNAAMRRGLDGRGKACSLLSSNTGHNMKPIVPLTAAVCLVISVPPATAAASTGWSQWRGPNRDGVSPEAGLLKKWPDGGPKLLWSVKGLGRGFSSVAISNGRGFVMGGRGDNQVVAAIDLATQKELWSAVVSAKEGEPRCTPTVVDGLVYAVSYDGEVLCCQASDGKAVWKKSFQKDFGQPGEPGWGFSESPLVDGDRVVLIPGDKEHFMVALNRKTGAVIWKTKADLKGSGHDGAGYTGAVVSTAGGVKQYVTMAGKGAIGVAASDGRLLWHYDRVANGTAVIPTPLVWDDHVFVSSGYGTGAALLKLVKSDAGVKAEEQYFLDASTFQNHHGGMVRIGNHIYAGRGHNNGFPVCIEWKTGKVVWEKDRGPGRESAAVIAADGNLYFRY